MMAIPAIRLNFGGFGELLLADRSGHLCILTTMSKRDQACALLRQGHSPSQIAAKMGLRVSYVMNYLWSKIGEGELRRSDIAFSLKRNIRREIESIVAEIKSQSATRICRELAKRGTQLSRYDVKMYLEYRRAPVVLGDMYEIVRNVEVRLHRFIKRVFIAEFGEEDWWRGGVPDQIRAECAALREKDPEPAAEPYNYTHLIALREILDRKWSVLSKYLPAEVGQNKKDLLERLVQLNRIRNNVMHPVRGGMLSEEEFEFVYTLDSDLGELSAPEVKTASGVAAESPGKPVNGPAPELVSTLAPVDDTPPPQEEAATTEQADGEDFIPTIKAS
jgi:predicted transcriptional regulator